MEAVAKSKMPRSYQRRSAEQRVADLEKKIAALKSRQLAREKKDDPLLREIKKLQKNLKRFIQLAHDHKRPDVANGAMGFKAMLERILSAELGPLEEADASDDEA
jgi:hypothetical protein